MNTFLARCTAIALGCSVAVVGALVAATCFRIEPLSGQVWGAWLTVFPDVEMRLASQGKLRDSAARAELAMRGDHAWPGVYRTAGVWPTELVLAPHAGFTLYHHSRCGNCTGFAAFGRVVAASEEELQLDVELSHVCATTLGHLDERLYLVRWGELLFAVAPQGMERFCAAVNDGESFPDEPVRVLGDATFDFDAPRRPEALPVVPSEWNPLLLATPIEARVGKLVELRPSDTNTNTSIYYHAVFELDRGSDAGLAVGMRVFVEPPPNRPASWSAKWGRLDEVERDRARFTLLVSDADRAWAETLVGKSTSTRHPLASTPNR